MQEAVKLLHLSDLHIGGNHHENGRMRQIFDWISLHHPGVPVLITGDLTQSGTTRQCRDARAMFDRLAANNPVLTVPGNHDYGFSGILFEQRAWENYYGFLAQPLGWPRSAKWTSLSLETETFVGVLEHGPVAYFRLDSCDPDDHEICARGLISRDLASKLRRELDKDKYSDKTRVVLLHHHPFTASMMTALKGSRRLMKAVEGRCEVVLFGHHHHCGVWWKESAVPMVVGSHKSPNLLFGESLGVGLIEIRDPGTPHASFGYQVEVVGEELVEAA